MSAHTEGGFFMGIHYTGINLLNLIFIPALFYKKGKNIETI